MGARFARFEKEVDKEKILCQGPSAMSTTINWKTATDAEKNACFAERVCGQDIHKGREWLSGDCVTTMRAPAYIKDYLHSADAVLPWLEKEMINIWHRTATGWNVIIHAQQGCGVENFNASSASFCEAAMITLLLGRGVKVLL